MRLIGLAIAISLFAAPIAAQTQPAGKVWRIGILQTSAQKDEAGRVAALEQGLAELGYVGGRNIVLVNRNAGQHVGRLPEFATDLVRAGVDVIVTSTNPATLAAKQATATIPIVMTVGVEPVAAGLVAGLAKPGANVTGLTFDVDATQLAAKRLEILKELMPSVSRVAVLWNPGYAPGGLRLKGTEQAGRSLGITIVSVHFSETSDAERAFTEIRRAKAEAVTVLPIRSPSHGDWTSPKWQRDIGCQRSTRCANGSRTAASSRTQPASMSSGAGPPAMSTKSSRGRSRPICPWNSRANSSWSSTSRPRRPSGSRSRRRSCCVRTR